MATEPRTEQKTDAGTESVEGRPPPPAEPSAAEAPEAPEKKRHSFFKELPVLIVIAFAIALLIKTFVLQAFYIPSASMETTLKIGDRVLVEKLTYRIGGPGRGDVVVFEKDLALAVSPGPEPDEPFWTDVVNAFRGLFGFPTGTEQDFIKRVIGVGGDEVQGRDGKVYVNGEVIEEDYLPEGVTTSDFGPTEVPAGTIFVMGDNRSNSDDSRHFGPVPVDTVVGRAFLLIWPPSEFDTL